MEIDTETKQDPINENGKRLRDNDDDVIVTKKQTTGTVIVNNVVEDIDRQLWLPELINGLVKKGIQQPIFRILDLLVEDRSFNTERLLEKVIGEMGKDKQVEWKHKIETELTVNPPNLIVFEFQECETNRGYHKHGSDCHFNTQKEAIFTSERLATHALYEYLKKEKFYKLQIKTVQEQYTFKIVEKFHNPPQFYSLEECREIVRVRKKRYVKLSDDKGLCITRKPFNVQIQ